MSESRKSHVDELALEMQKKAEVGSFLSLPFKLLLRNLLIPNPDPENLASRSGFLLMTENLKIFPLKRKFSVFNQRNCSISILFIRRPL
jgi:hypothetical protein